MRIVVCNVRKLRSAFMMSTQATHRHAIQMLIAEQRVIVGMSSRRCQTFVTSRKTFRTRNLDAVEVLRTIVMSSENSPLDTAA